MLNLLSQFLAAIGMVAFGVMLLLPFFENDTGNTRTDHNFLGKWMMFSVVGLLMCLFLFICT